MQPGVFVCIARVGGGRRRLIGRERCFGEATTQNTTLDAFYAITRSLKIFSVHYETVAGQMTLSR